MRRAFIADDGWGLLTADYSQIELRVLAHLAEDPGLIDAFERGVDVHTATAAKVFHVAESKVDAEQRRFAKVVNYGLAYGMEAYGLGQRLGIPTDEAARSSTLLRELSRTSKSYMEETVAGGAAAGLHDHDLRSPAADRRAVVRQLPHPPDGGAHGAERAGAGIGGRHLQARHDRARPRARGRRVRHAQMLLTVHDELVLEVPLDERDVTESIVREVMENVTELRVPLVVDIGFGPTWAEAK